MARPEEHYSLRWNNHQHHLLRAFAALLRAEALVDVTLVCAEGRVRAHKVVLSACSPFFRRIFSENPCKHPVIVLKDFHGWEVQAVIDFMYRGEISVAQEQLKMIIKAGEALQVRGLVEQDGMSGDRDGGSLGEETPSPEPTLSSDGGEEAPQVPPHGPGDSPGLPSLPVLPGLPGLPGVPGITGMPGIPNAPEVLPGGIGSGAPICCSPLPRRKQARPRRRSGEGPQDLSLGARRDPPPPALKDVRRPSLRPDEDPRGISPDLPPPRLPPPDPLPFPPAPSVSALALTPPHKKCKPGTPDANYDLHTQPFCYPVFGLDSGLGLFPPGMDPGKLYSPLMEMPDPRAPHHDPHIFPISNVKKKWRPKGQHSAPRGGPPRSWTNAELTEALQHVWNKKMTTSQASRIFGIPYNSLLMYVRGKYGKSLKLEQLRKDCIGGPLDILTMGPGSNNNNNPTPKHHHVKDEQNAVNQMNNQRPASSEPDLMSSPLFNPFSQGFYPEFPPGFPMPLNMLHLLPPGDKTRDIYGQTMPLALDMLTSKEDDCKSDRSKENSADEDPDHMFRPPPLTRDDRREILQQNGQD